MKQILRENQNRTTYAFYLNGLNCPSCANKIEDKLNKLGDISDISLNFSTKRLKVTSYLERNEIHTLIQNTVDSIEDGVTVSESSSSHLDMPSQTQASSIFTGNKRIFVFAKNQYKAIIGTILLFILIGFEFGFSTELIAYIISYLLIGGKIAYTAFRNLLKGQLFDENFLMTLATIGAFMIGEFTEAVAVMLFYKIGEGFQDHAIDQSRRNIQTLLNIKAEYANLVIDNKTTQVSPSDLKIDDIIQIKAGEKVPVDCLVISGQSTIDSSALTGESLPHTIIADEELLSGSINIATPLTARVLKTFEDSTVSKILDMVENASSKKAKTEQFITKFSKIYTPIVVLLATILAFLPPLFGLGSLREWLSRALIFLVISCPCALVLSVPLGFFGGLGAASKRGILIKGGNYLEALHKIDTFVFDKTGTLTKGNFALVNVLGKKTLEYAANLEVHSTHPIGKSIINAYDKDISHDAVTHVNEIPGEGLTGVYNGNQLCAGNIRLMSRLNITVPKNTFIGTVIYVAYKSKYYGALEIADQIKDGVDSLSYNLKALGAKSIIMLTGDQENIAEQVAEKLEINQVFAKLLPGDKLSHIENLINKGHHVLFVGDGINDAPVLARADIGVAMGGLGSDAAIEAADIVLMTDEPQKLIDAIYISKRTRKIVMQNILFALSIKIFFLILGAFGITSMYEAIFADVGVSLLAVFNSMRAIK